MKRVTLGMKHWKRGWENGKDRDGGKGSHWEREDSEERERD